MSDCPCPVTVEVCVVAPQPIDVTARVGTIFYPASTGGSGDVPSTRTFTAGSGLVGGGDLSANRTFAVNWGTETEQVPRGDDARFTDARTPLSHAASHTEGGDDEIAVTPAQVIGLVAELIGKVSTARTVNGHPLSSNVTVTAGDVGLGNVADLAPADLPVSTAQADADAAVLAAANTYADALIAAADALVFKGVINGVTSPDYPDADAGWTYRVSAAGEVGGIGGQPVQVGDLLLCLVDGTPSGDQATVGNNWAIVQGNIDGAVIGPTSALDGNLVVFDGPSGRLIRDGGSTGTYGLSVLATVDRAAFLSLVGLTDSDIPTLPVSKTDGLQSALDDLDSRSTAIETALPGKVTATLDTDSTMAADSDSRVPSQKAVNARILSIVSADTVRADFSNTNISVLSSYRRVFQTGSLSADRSAFLPAANSVPVGTTILIADESGTASTAAGIIIVRAGADTINGTTAETIRVPYGFRVLYSDGISKWTFDGGVMRKTGGTFTGPVVVQPSNVTYGASVTIDAATVQEAQITLTGDLSLANPTGGTHGQKLLLVLTQGGSGNYTVTFAGSKFSWTADIASFTASTAVGKIDFVGLRYDANRDKWDIIAVNKGAG